MSCLCSLIGMLFFRYSLMGLLLVLKLWLISRWLIVWLVLVISVCRMFLLYSMFVFISSMLLLCVIVLVMVCMVSMLLRL